MSGLILGTSTQTGCETWSRQYPDLDDTAYGDLQVSDQALHV